MILTFFLFFTARAAGTDIIFRIYNYLYVLTISPKDINRTCPGICQPQASESSGDFIFLTLNIFL